MLNRRILRIKAFKTIYCYAENHGMTLKEAEALLDISCESTRDLYLFLLALTGPLTDEARTRIEAARAKFNPTEEERKIKMEQLRPVSKKQKILFPIVVTIFVALLVRLRELIWTAIGLLLIKMERKGVKSDK